MLRYKNYLNKKCILWNKLGEVEEHFIGNKSYYLFRTFEGDAVELNQWNLAQIVVIE